MLFSKNMHRNLDGGGTQEVRVFAPDGGGLGIGTLEVGPIPASKDKNSVCGGPSSTAGPQQKKN